MPVEYIYWPLTIIQTFQKIWPNFQIIEKMMSGLGDDEIDPAMMAALMATTALVAQGASNEEVSSAIQNMGYNFGWVNYVSFC